MGKLQDSWKLGVVTAFSGFTGPQEHIPVGYGSTGGAQLLKG